jgi:hypothetical protein
MALPFGILWEPADEDPPRRLSAATDAGARAAAVIEDACPSRMKGNVEPVDTTPVRFIKTLAGGSSPRETALTHGQEPPTHTSAPLPELRYPEEDPEHEDVAGRPRFLAVDLFSQLISLEFLLAFTQRRQRRPLILLASVGALLAVLAAWLLGPNAGDAGTWIP